MTELQHTSLHDTEISKLCCSEIVELFPPGSFVTKDEVSHCPYGQTVGNIGAYVIPDYPNLFIKNINGNLKSTTEEWPIQDIFLLK